LFHCSLFSPLYEYCFSVFQLLSHRQSIALAVSTVWSITCSLVKWLRLVNLTVTAFGYYRESNDVFLTDLYKASTVWEWNGSGLDQVIKLVRFTSIDWKDAFMVQLFFCFVFVLVTHGIFLLVDLMWNPWFKGDKKIK